MNWARICPKSLHFLTYEIYYISLNHPTAQWFNFDNFTLLKNTENIYRIFVNSFRGNYSFLNLALCTVTKGHRYIKVRKLFKGGNYSRKYGIWFKLSSSWLLNLALIWMPITAQLCNSALDERLNSRRW